IVSSVWEPPLSDVGILAAASAVVTAALAVFAAGHTVVLCAGALLFVGVGLVWVHVAANTLLPDGLPGAARAGALRLAHRIEAGGLLIGQGMGALLGSAWGPRGLLAMGLSFLVVGVVVASLTARQVGGRDV